MPTHTTRKGYKRYHRGKLRNKYVHRVVTAESCKEWCYYSLDEDGLPIGFNVHHIDFNKQHNCKCNLLLLDKRIHDAINPTMQCRCPYTGRAMEREEWFRLYGTVPDWVTRIEEE